MAGSVCSLMTVDFVVVEFLGGNAIGGRAGKKA